MGGVVFWDWGQGLRLDNCENVYFNQNFIFQFCHIIQASHIWQYQFEYI